MRVLTTLLLISVLAVGCGKKKQQELDLPIRPVNYIEVSGEQLFREKEFSGTVAAKVITELSFRVSGTIEKRQVDLGNKVEKGDILAQLDSTDYQLAYNRSLALYTNSKANFERDRVLYLENSISKAQYENSMADYKAKESEMKLSKQQLDYTTILAPAKGEIALVNAEINQTVPAGQTIFILNEVGGLEVEFNVSDIDVNRLKLGQEVSVKVVATGAEVRGVISNIGSVSTSYGKTFPVKATLFTVPSDIKPGMTVNLKVSIDDKKGKAIPGISINKDKNGVTSVYVIKNVKDGEGVIQKAVITLGGVVEKEIEVLAGLEEGDLVVTDGANLVYEGQKVKLGNKGE